MIRRIVTVALLSSGIAFCQSGPQPSATPARPLAFEVVSMRPASPNSNLVLSYRTTPDGYSVPGQSLFFTIMMAYFPQGGLYW